MIDGQVGRFFISNLETKMTAPIVAPASVCVTARRRGGDRKVTFALTGGKLSHEERVTKTVRMRPLVIARSQRG